MAMIRTFVTFSLFVAFFACSLGAQENVWTSPPDEFPNDRILSSFYEDLNGGVYGTQLRGFEYANRTVSIFVRYLDELPDGLSDAQRNLFVRRTLNCPNGPKDVFEYIIGQPTQPFELPAQDPIAGVSNLRAPSCPTECDPQTMTIQQLAELIKSTKLFFFTGAGISAAAGIHTVATLWEALGRQPAEAVDDFVRLALDNPEELIAEILSFYAAARDNPPTAAHQAITQIALARGFQVVTSNFDRLHHRTGILPYRTMGRNVEDDLARDGGLEAIEAIVTVGLARDTRGILNAFRQRHPLRPVIAVNLQRPPYLGSHDFFVQGDAQAVFRELAAADDRRGLERQLRYMGRPPLSEERLSKTADGKKIIVRLKTPWSDGTSTLVLTPSEFLERLVAIVPPPRKNMIRYSGVFAPNSHLREQIVPKQETTEDPIPKEESRHPKAKKSWAKLMSRVFDLDVLECPRCKSQMQMLSFITEPKAIMDILACLKMATAPPEKAKAQSPDQGDFAYEYYEFDYAQ